MTRLAAPRRFTARSASDDAPGADDWLHTRWEDREVVTAWRGWLGPGAVSARVASVVLGGDDHWAADRFAARQLCEADPAWAKSAASARTVLLAASAAVAARGVGQFVDLGCGLTAGEPGTALAPLHSAVLAAHLGALTVYVDRDLMVMAHVRALMRPSGPAGIRYTHGDLADPRTLLDALHTGVIGLNWRYPVAVVLSDVLHELTDDQARSLLDALYKELPAGSVLLLSHRGPGADSLAPAVASVHAEAALPWYPRGAGQLSALTGRWQPLGGALPAGTPGFTTVTASGRWAP